MAKRYLLSFMIAACICCISSVSVSAEEGQHPATMETEWQKLHETWDGLSKRQKESLYKAREAVDKADCNFIDRAVKLELIEKQIGDRMKEHIKARTAQIRQAEELPMFRRGMRQHKPQ